MFFRPRSIESDVKPKSNGSSGDAPGTKALIDAPQSQSESRNSGSNSSRMGKSNIQKSDGHRDGLEPINLLIDVVSASDLISPDNDGSNSSIRTANSTTSTSTATSDPFVIVKHGSDEIHRTLPVKKTTEPIWTIKSDSLFLFAVTNSKELELYGGLTFEVCDAYSKFSHGVVTVPFEDGLLHARGKRMEFTLRKKVVKVDGTSEIMEQGTLVLRCRHATEEDLAFMKNLMDKKNKSQSYLSYAVTSKQNITNTTTRKKGQTKFSASVTSPRSTDMNFTDTTVASTRKRIFRGNRKIGPDKITRFLVQPYPDPNQIEETTWLSKVQLNTMSLQPSHKWVEAGCGSLGMVYVEIIGCNSLPNMDISGLDKTNVTDSFVAIAFEDALVRTDVIHDCLSPRWMPWCNRAFAFPIAHPSSIVMIAVFDYDPGPFQHDPIGRVVINTSRFESSTAYLLHYELHHDPHQNDSRGTICIRLRVEWHNEKESIQQAFATPPRFHINVDSDKAFRVLRYLCRGQINMEKASIQSVKLYGAELVSYFYSYFYLIDVVIGILLWRGRMNLSIPRPDWVTPSASNALDSGTNSLSSDPENSEPSNNVEVSVWFPIHSIVLFQGAVLAVERPSLIPALTLFVIAWIMRSINYNYSHSPSPWHRCKSMHETNMVLLSGHSVHPPIFVKENEGVREQAALEAVARLRSERIINFLLAFKTAGLQYKRQYNKTEVTGHSIETEDKDWALFGDKLYYLHLALSYMCIYIRMIRNLVTWKSHYSHSMTVYCILGGIVFLFIQWDRVILWSARFWVWTFLGPWMKLVDMYFIHPHYKTIEELIAQPKVEPPNIESILKIVNMKRLARRVRIATEEAQKLKDMREHRYGKYSEHVPAFDTSRFASIPLPQSTAVPYVSPELKLKNNDGYHDLPRDQVHWSKIKGQKLHGNMAYSLDSSSNLVDLDDEVNEESDDATPVRF